MLISTVVTSVALEPASMQTLSPRLASSSHIVLRFKIGNTKLLTSAISSYIFIDSISSLRSQQRRSAYNSFNKSSTTNKLSSVCYTNGFFVLRNKRGTAQGLSFVTVQWFYLFLWQTCIVPNVEQSLFVAA